MRKHGPIKLTISERELLEELRVGWGLRTTREALREAIKFAHAETEPEEVYEAGAMERIKLAEEMIARHFAERMKADADAQRAADDILAGLGMLKRQ